MKKIVVFTTRIGNVSGSSASTESGDSEDPGAE